MGSGLVAGESSAAYDETFTHTCVTLRSVGIGAYSGRLGQRVVQNENAATAILTSFSALNNCIVHDVCLSHNQLGCAKSMHPNGTKQLVVQDDAHGISAVRDWLIFVTVARGQTLPIVESREVVTLKIEGFPPPDGQWSDNAVIEYLIRLGKPEFYLSRQRLSQQKSIVMLPRHARPQPRSSPPTACGNCVQLFQAGTQARYQLGK
jgi:Carboxyl transferase domain